MMEEQTPQRLNGTLFVTQREIDLRFSAAETAIRVARDDINSRISMQYDQICAMRDREVTFHTRASHDDFVHQIEARMETMRRELAPRWGWLSAAMGALLALFSYAIHLEMGPLQSDIESLRQRLNMIQGTKP